jgi:hypothetical protein
MWIDMVLAYGHKTTGNNLPVPGKRICSMQSPALTVLLQSICQNANEQPTYIAPIVRR